MNHTLDNFNIMDFLFILKKHLRIIIICTLLLSVAAMLYSKFILIPKYKATAMLIVNASNGSNQNTTRTSDDITMSQKLVDTYALIMTSDPVLDKVISDLRLDTTAEDFKKTISIVPVGTTEVMLMTVINESPETAAAIANDITRVAPNEIMADVDAGSVSIISPAKVDRNKVSPNIIFNTIIAFIIGIVLSVSYALIKELLDNTFKSDEDIQKVLDLTVIGVIPTHEEKK